MTEQPTKTEVCFNEDRVALAKNKNGMTQQLQRNHSNRVIQDTGRMGEMSLIMHTILAANISGVVL